MKRLVRRPVPNARQHGLALVGVLVLTGLLVTLSAVLSYSARLEALAVRNQIDSARAHHLAEGALQLGMHQLLQSPPSRYVPIDGTRRPLSAADAELWLAVEDESGRIDLNRAPAPLIESFLAGTGLVAGERAALLENILARRRPVRAARLAGGERSGDPFARIAELAALPNVTPSLLRQLAAHLTVHGDTRINPLAAPRAVLLAVPGTREPQVEEWLATRYTADATAPRWPAQYVGPPVPGRVYRLTAEARLPAARAAVETIVRVGGQEALEVLEWRRVQSPGAGDSP